MPLKRLLKASPCKFMNAPSQTVQEAKLWEQHNGAASSFGKAQHQTERESKIVPIPRSLLKHNKPKLVPL